MQDRTLRALSRAAVAIHEAGAAPERWREAVTAAMELLGAERGGVLDLRGDPLALETLVTVGNDEQVERLYAEHYFSVDPNPQSALAAAPREVFDSYERFDESLRARHEYFAWARRNGIGDAVIVGTDEIDGRRCLLSLVRPPDAGAFGDEAKKLMELLAPHLQQARLVQARLGGASFARRRLEEALDCFAAAAFLVDARRRVLHFNRAAGRLLESSPALAVRHDRLEVAEPRLEAQLGEALRRALSPSAFSSVLAVRLSESDERQLVVAPLPAERGDERDEAFALVAIAAPPASTAAIEWRLRRLYRLTATEARVAAQIALGRTVEEIAALHGVKEATLRTQLRTVFQKTGTARQVELARVALTAASILVEGDL